MSHSGRRPKRNAVKDIAWAVPGNNSEQNGKYLHAIFKIGSHARILFGARARHETWTGKR